ncbi:hypothetical protein [Devosia sp. Root105]|uniref:CIS tube protein n=1 Tax=Devosia sp. Root105 TaxID=1736423 RepID=UPI000701FA2A|nr:hypothetical protein [Devosia sp. Root105]KQU97668.1 hypothetical protein ASC68_12855 [Devosia sp. Root105]
MERIAFLVERTGEQLFCLLNPENVVVRRSAGVVAHGATTGIITGMTMTDDPLIATGGGSTEIDLDLLFDTEIDNELRPRLPAAIEQQEGEPSLVAPAEQSDVRDMTRPIWNLAENGETTDGFGAPPLVRMIWGRAWNIPGVVMAVSEKFERFAADGRPQRSWLRLRLKRVDYDDAGASPARLPATSQFELPHVDGLSGTEDRAVRVTLSPDENGLPTPRIDEIVADYYGDTSLVHAVLSYNNIADPLDIAEGTILVLPDPASLVEP